MKEMSTSLALAIAAFALNAGALVWGAGKMAGAIENLKEVTIELKGLFAMLAETVHNHTARISVLEDRANIDYKRDA